MVRVVALSLALVSHAACVAIAQKEQNPLARGGRSDAIQNAPPVIQLRAGDHIVLPNYRLGFPIHCDADRNVYLKTATGNPASTIIQKIRPDGSLAASLSYVQEKRNKQVYFDDFSVSADGTVSAITRFGPTLPIEIIQFDGDGKIAHHITLEPDIPLWPRQIVALSGGGFFVAGVVRGDKETGAHDRAYAALYNDSGQLQREIRLKGDLSTVTSATDERSVDYSLAVAGDDGNIYLLRATEPAKMYAISSGGKVLSEYAVEAPVAGTTPIAMLAHQGRLAVMFHMSEDDSLDDTRIRILEPSNGQPVVDYKTDKTLGEGLACSTATEFVFYSTTLYKMPVLVDAPIR